MRFEFGKNWESYLKVVDESHLAEAVQRLEKLVPREAIEGKTLIDIGCGSGIHSLAALRMGASRVVAVDLDQDSVRTTRETLARFWQGDNYQVEIASVFDITPETYGTFDVVYSWGVLHHTGDVNKAIEQASGLVKTGGLFVVALYGKTKFCGAWKKIKHWYINANEEEKRRAEERYVRLFGAYLLLRGKRLSTHVANYKKKRGMDFMHDVKDWLGGYPYESIRPSELQQILAPLGLTPVSVRAKRRSGLFGSGCDEYVYRKSS
jgi:2-polyprenyl-6-hydroxyphenyl methylase/3-demethylubiquinone-9 3-methyltransferase